MGERGQAGVERAEDEEILLWDSDWVGEEHKEDWAAVLALTSHGEEEQGY